MDGLVFYAKARAFKAKATRSKPRPRINIPDRWTSVSDGNSVLWCREKLRQCRNVKYHAEKLVLSTYLLVFLVFFAKRDRLFSADFMSGLRTYYVIYSFVYLLQIFAVVTMKGQVLVTGLSPQITCRYFSVLRLTVTAMCLFACITCNLMTRVICQGRRGMLKWQFLSEVITTSV